MHAEPFIIWESSPRPCKYCKGTGKYRLLNRLVDCDQCDAAERCEIEYGGPRPTGARFVDEWVQSAEDLAGDNIDEVPF